MLCLLFPLSTWWSCDTSCIISGPRATSAEPVPAPLSYYHHVYHTCDLICTYVVLVELGVFFSCFLFFGFGGFSGFLPDCFVDALFFFPCLSRYHSPRCFLAFSCCIQQQGGERVLILGHSFTCKYSHPDKLMEYGRLTSTTGPGGSVLKGVSPHLPRELRS